MSLSLFTLVKAFLDLGSPIYAFGASSLTTLILLILPFVTATAPLFLRFFICYYRNDGFFLLLCLSFLSFASWFIVFFLLVFLLFWGIIDSVGGASGLYCCFTSCWAITASPELSITQKYSTMFITAENLFDQDKFLVYDRVKISFCLVKNNMVRYNELFWSSISRTFTKSELLMGVFAPSINRAIFDAAYAHFFNFFLENLTFVFIGNS